MTDTRRRSPSATRERLISTAERLFADRGIDAVSLREISLASGARNPVAIQYHFDDRAGIVAAIMTKHEPPIDAARHVMLDDLASAQGDLRRPLAAALVRPLATKLSDPEGGPQYLQINAEMFYRTIGPPTTVRPSSIERWRAATSPYLNEDAVRLHRRYIAALYTAIDLGRRARTGPHPDDRLFISALIDVVVNILFGPVSDETQRLTEERHHGTGSAHQLPSR